jgi:L-ascorbate metabolism protein UlaG (beta-lactamase superfamily)
MQIQWFGQSYFKIQTKHNGNDVVIATDPYDKTYGLKPPKFQADIVTISHDHNDHNNIKAINGDPFVITNPGEYETKGAFIYGIPSWHDTEEGKVKGANTMYRINVEDMNIVHLGDLGQDLTDEQLEKLSNVDILMIPVGGVYTIDAKRANEIINKIEPRIVIPMHYQIPGLKFKSGGKLDSLDSFLKISGLTPETVDKFKISKKDLPAEETKLIVIKP